MNSKDGTKTHSDSDKRRIDWNNEVIVGIMNMLYDARFYGQAVFTFANGAVKSVDINQHLKFPSEKPVVVSEREG